MKLEELRKKTKEETRKILQDDREKLRQLRFDLAAGKVKNVREIRKTRKEIARALTLLKNELPKEAKAARKVEPSLPEKE